jgi:integrase
MYQPINHEMEEKSMSTSSIAHQVSRCLDILFLTKEEIEAMKQEQGVASLKRALRPGGDPTKPIPYILSYRTYRTYFAYARLFFRRAQADTGERLLSNLLNHDVILAVYQKYYAELAPGTVSATQCAIKKIFSGAELLGWVSGPCPIENDFRDLMEIHYRPPRYGYHPRDAQRIIDLLVENKSRCALAAKLSLYCGLRAHENAGLMGEHVDCDRQILTITGKGGLKREVPFPKKLLPELTRKSGYFFTPSISWRRYFWGEVSKAAKKLGIEDTGVHRLRSTYAELVYAKRRAEGWDDKAARMEVAHLLGHGRREVTFHYIPDHFDWQTYQDNIILLE